VQDAAKVMSNLRDVAGLGIGRYHEQRHAEAVNISRPPAGAVVNNLGRRNVIVSPSPIVPGNDNDSMLSG
jgi:hypothetical protein